MHALLFSLLSVPPGGTTIRVLKVQVLVHDKFIFNTILSIRPCADVHRPQTPVVCQCYPIQDVTIMREMVHHTLSHVHCLAPVIKSHIELLGLSFMFPWSIVPDMSIGWDRMSSLPPYLLRDQSSHCVIYFLHHNNIVL